MWEWINWKDLLSALLPTLVSIYVAHLAIVSTRAENRRKATDARDKEDREKADRDAKAEQVEDAAQATDLTARFKALMDGYENRIRDISADNMAMKAEVRDFRQRFESHQRVCQGCPHYIERIAKRAEPT